MHDHISYTVREPPLTDPPRSRQSLYNEQTLWHRLNLAYSVNTFEERTTSVLRITDNDHPPTDKILQIEPTSAIDFGLTIMYFMVYLILQARLI